MLIIDAASTQLFIAVKKSMNRLSMKTLPLLGIILRVVRKEICNGNCQVRLLGSLYCRH